MGRTWVALNPRVPPITRPYFLSVYPPLSIVTSSSSHGFNSVITHFPRCCAFVFLIEINNSQYEPLKSADPYIIPVSRTQIIPNFQTTSKTPQTHWYFYQRVLERSPLPVIISAIQSRIKFSIHTTSRTDRSISIHAQTTPPIQIPSQSRHPPAYSNQVTKETNLIAQLLTSQDFNWTQTNQKSFHAKNLSSSIRTPLRLLYIAPYEPAIPQLTDSSV